MVIKVNKELCIGAGTCTVIAPEVFEFDDNLKAQVKDPKGAPEDLIIDAAKSCPVLAIILEDEDGEQIYP